MPPILHRVGCPLGRWLPLPPEPPAGHSSELPKTRSGKIMRRLLRDVAENRSLGDVTTLQDSAVMDLISSGLQTGKSED